MRDLAPLLIAICGLSIVCVGLLALAGFVLARYTGGAFLSPWLDLLQRDQADDDEPGLRRTRPTPPQPGRSRAKDWRARAQSLDFNTAVDKHRQQPGVARGRPAIRQPQGPDLLSSGDDEPPDRSLRRDRACRRDDDAAIYDD